MREVRETVDIDVACDVACDVVARVEAYPLFVEGCRQARVAGDNHGEVRASVTLRRGGIETDIPLRLAVDAPDAVSIVFDTDYFSALETAWSFSPIGEGGCRIELTLGYEFGSRAQSLLLGPTVSRAARRLIETVAGEALRRSSLDAG